MGGVLLAGPLQTVDEPPVHRFTGGHPRSVRVLLDSVADKVTERIDLLVALRAPVRDVLAEEPVTVEDWLIEPFQQGDAAAALPDLITLSAATGRDHALRLTADSGLMTWARGERSLIFGQEFWMADGGGQPAAGLRPADRRYRV